MKQEMVSPVKFKKKIYVILQTYARLSIVEGSTSIDSWI